MIKLFFQIYHNILNKETRKKSIHFIILNIIYSLLDLFSIAAIMPIIFIVAGGNFETLNINLPSFIIEKINYIYFTENPLFTSAIFILLIFSLKFVFSLYVNFFNTRLNYYLTQYVKVKVFKKFTKKKYEEVLRYNSSQMMNSMSTIPELAIGVFYISFLVLFKSLFMISLLIFSLFLINFKITFFLFIISSTVLIIYFLIFKKKIKSLGTRRVIYSELLYKYIQEFSRGFSIIKLYGLEKKLSSRFSEKAMNFGYVKTLFKYVNSLPNIAFEISLLLMVFFLLYVLNNLGYSKEYIISFLGAFFILGMKLLPQVLLCFSIINKLKNAQPSSHLLLSEFNENEEKKIIHEPINFEKIIEFEKINFNFENNEKLFDELSLKINYNSKIGIMGKSGSGKSTLINIICGFLIPQKGKILIDQNLMSENNLFYWQKNISIVDQQTFLFNDSIENNITLVSSGELINQDRLNDAINKSQLNEFISGLEQGVKTIINQDSTNLSGGEKQRLSIARALYRNRKILILDEQTSALDKENSQKVINIIKNLENITTIIITHDKEILSICDKKYLLENKKINEITY